MISVLIADDQALVRAGVRMIVDAHPDMTVAGEAADGGEAVELARTLNPDIVLMDIRMPGVDGIEASRRLLGEPGVPSAVLVLTTLDQDEVVYDALRAGAAGFLLKSAPPERLVAAVRTVAAGDALLAPEITRRMIEEFVRRPRRADAAAGPLAELTDREAEVLALIGRGRSNAEIAGHLVVSEGTVKTHVNRIFRKLAVRDRAQAVVVAYETGLVEPGAADVQG
jgi:DNA-binding NarL/FixJ family response regulator